MESNFDKTYFGEQLKKLRKAKKITQSELGKYLNVGQTTISNWEKGIREPENIGEVIKLADFFKVDLSFLIKDTEEQKKKQYGTLKEMSENVDWSNEIHQYETKQQLLNEISTLDNNLIEEVLNFIKFLKTTRKDH